MLTSKFIKYLFASTILFASCRASRNVATYTNDEAEPTIVVAVPAHNFSKEIAMSEPAQPPLNSGDTIETNVIEEAVLEVTTASATTKLNKKITSFTQMKEMARTGKIAMSKKDLKTLNRLEKHYKGNYEQFRADTFEFSNKAKIIGGVGLLGLLLAIITGSAFGWFLFVVAALAFLLRYLNIIAF